jgi:hypothetical protein
MRRGGRVCRHRHVRCGGGQREQQQEECVLAEWGIAACVCPSARFVCCKYAFVVCVCANQTCLRRSRFQACQVAHVSIRACQRRRWIRCRRRGRMQARNSRCGFLGLRTFSVLMPSLPSWRRGSAAPSSFWVHACVVSCGGAGRRMQQAQFAMRVFGFGAHFQ